MSVLCLRFVEWACWVAGVLRICPVFLSMSGSGMDLGWISSSSGSSLSDLNHYLSSDHILGIGIDLVGSGMDE